MQYVFSKYEKKPKVTIYNSIQQGKISATVTNCFE